MCFCKHVSVYPGWENNIRQVQRNDSEQYLQEQITKQLTKNNAQYENYDLITQCRQVVFEL